MENQKNRFISVAYHLYTDGDNGRELVEETLSGQPFQFITGFGYALEAFELQLYGQEAGATFKFSLDKEQAYGDYEQDRILELEREMFCIDGRFDHARVFPDAMIPLQNEEGTRFYGRVLEVGEEKVKVDLNHPLAGQKLHFEGTVIENREATQEEVDALIARLTGGCGGGCNCNGEGNCENCK